MLCQYIPYHPCISFHCRVIFFKICFSNTTVGPLPIMIQRHLNQLQPIRRPHDLPRKPRILPNHQVFIKSHLFQQRTLIQLVPDISPDRYAFICRDHAFYSQISPLDPYTLIMFHRMVFFRFDSVQECVKCACDHIDIIVFHIFQQDLVAFRMHQIIRIQKRNVRPSGLAYAVIPGRRNAFSAVFVQAHISLRILCECIAFLNRIIRAVVINYNHFKIRCCLDVQAVQSICNILSRIICRYHNRNFYHNFTFSSIIFSESCRNDYI